MSMLNLDCCLLYHMTSLLCDYIRSVLLLLKLLTLCVLLHLFHTTFECSGGLWVHSYQRTAGYCRSCGGVAGVGRGEYLELRTSSTDEFVQKVHLREATGA